MARTDMQRQFRPYSAEAMTATAVDPWVNDARHEGARCVERAADDPSP